MLTVFQLVTFAVVGFAAIIAIIHFVFRSTYLECSTCRREKEIQSMDVRDAPPIDDDDDDDAWSDV